MGVGKRMHVLDGITAVVGRVVTPSRKLSQLDDSDAFCASWRTDHWPVPLALGVRG